MGLRRVKSSCGRFRPLTASLALLGVISAAGCSRSAPQGPPKPPPSPLEYLGEWGTRGDGPGQLSHPVSLAVDTTGNAYIADPGSGFVHKFDPQGHPLLSFQDPALGHPDGIAVDVGGAIYVADSGRGSVIIFYPDGSRFREIRCAPRRSAKDSLAVTVDEEGNMFVLDARFHRIQRFNLRGRLEKAWGRTGSEPGERKSPVRVALGPDGFLYFSDAGNQRIEKFTRDGDFVAAFGGSPPGAAAGLAGIAVSERYVFAADPGAYRIHVWTLDGQHKLTDDLGNRLGSQDPALYDIAVSPRGELLVLDPAGARVLRFRINF